MLRFSVTVLVAALFAAGSALYPPARHAAAHPFALSLSHATTTTAGWNAYVWDARFSSLHAAPATSGGGLAAFPLQSNMTALLTTTSANGLVGNLTGKTLVATMSLGYTGTITYGYEGSSQNACGAPANARFFLSTDRKTYSPSTASRNETGYWWSNPFNVPLTGQLSRATLSVPLNANDWSDANGHLGSNPAYTAGFNSAVAGVNQIGLSFGGGCFFDVGIGVANGSGSFTLNSMAAQ